MEKYTQNHANEAEKVELTPEEIRYIFLESQLNLFSGPPQRLTQHELKDRRQQGVIESNAITMLPELVVEESDTTLSFMVFTPNNPNYSRSITSLQGDKNFHVKQSTLDPSSEYYRGNRPDEWDRIMSALTELEKNFDIYSEAALRLTAIEAQLLGFSDEYVNFLKELREQT